MTTDVCCPGETTGWAGAHSLFRIPAQGSDRLVQFAAWGTGRRAWLSVSVETANGVGAGGLVSLKDVRRLHRAVSCTGTRARLALTPGGPLAGGVAGVVDAGDDELYVVVTGAGQSLLFGPVPREVMVAVCRALVTWHRLLQPADTGAEGAGHPEYVGA